MSVYLFFFTVHVMEQSFYRCIKRDEKMAIYRVSRGGGRARAFGTSNDLDLLITTRQEIQ